MLAQHIVGWTVDPDTGCWLWNGATRQGYARTSRDGRLVSLHHWHWEHEHGPVPEGMDLDHICHTKDGSCKGGATCLHRRCVNPDHLEPVSRAVNVQRGRLGKLTSEQVAEIRSQPTVPRARLASRYGVTVHTITYIRTKRAWTGVGDAHVKREPLGAPMAVRTTALTESEVAEIQAAPRHYGSGRALAHRYGVTDAVISAIRTGPAGMKVRVI